MEAPPFEEIKESIESRLEETNEMLGELEYPYHKIKANLFYDFLAGETFIGDKTTIRDTLGNEYLMIHEVVKITELINLGATIGKKTLLETPKVKIYEALLNAVEFELEYSLLLEDYYWLKHRLLYHKRVIDALELPVIIKERAEEIWDHYKEYLKY